MGSRRLVALVLAVVLNAPYGAAGSSDGGEKDRRGSPGKEPEPKVVTVDARQGADQAGSISHIGWAPGTHSRRRCA
jgi:hypothetical protein